MPWEYKFFFSIPDTITKNFVSILNLIFFTLTNIHICKTNMKFSENEKACIRNIFENSDEPLFLKNFANHWGCLKWTQSQWESFFQQKLLPVRIGLKANSSTPQWESKCKKFEISYSLFLQFLNDDEIIINNEIYNSNSHWIYIDYLYMKDFEIGNDIEDGIPFYEIGFPEIQYKDSTLWIGTAGAHTPCHQDTYGFNIVVQIYGSKTWTLISKTETCNLYPTRVPYEETSIYSEVCFPSIDFDEYPKMRNAKCMVVVLKPGDILVVPKHTWHFVENNEFSISVNCWIPVQSDYNDKIKEAITQYQIGNIIQGLDDIDILKSLLNPNMCKLVELTPEENMENLCNALTNIRTLKTNDNVPFQVSHVCNSTDCKHFKSKFFEALEPLKLYSLPDYVLLRLGESIKNPANHESDKKKPSLVQILAKSLTDPMVVEQIAKNMSDYI